MPMASSDANSNVYFYTFWVLVSTLILFFLVDVLMVIPGNQPDNGLLLLALLCVSTFMRPEPFPKVPAIHYPNPEEEMHWIQGRNATRRNRIAPENLATNASSSLLYLKKLGLNIVKCMVLLTSLSIAPYVVSIALNVFQECETNPSIAASKEIVVLKLYFGSTTVNVALGVILYMLSTAMGSFYGKALFLKVTICLTFVSAVMEIVMLFAVALQFAP